MQNLAITIANVRKSDTTYRQFFPSFEPVLYFPHCVFIFKKRQNSHGAVSLEGDHALSVKLTRIHRPSIFPLFHFSHLFLLTYRFALQMSTHRKVFLFFPPDVVFVGSFIFFRAHTYHVRVLHADYLEHYYIADGR